MLKHALMATAITLAAVSAQAGDLLTENFGNITALAGSGWVRTNQSAPIGITDWAQGDSGIFSAQAGAVDSYISANFSNAGVGGQINNWLISPTFSTATAGTVSFWARGVDEAPFFDTISFAFASGSGSNTASFTGGTAMTLTGQWTEYKLDFAAQGAGSVGRFAINYFGAEATSNFIGIDTVSVAAIPEPSTWAMMSAGLFGVVAFARRRAAAKR